MRRSTLTDSLVRRSWIAVGADGVGADPAGAPAQGEGPVRPGGGARHAAAGASEHDLDAVRAAGPDPPLQDEALVAEHTVAGQVEGDVGPDPLGSVLGRLLCRGRNSADRYCGGSSHRGQEISHRVITHSLSRLPTGLADGLAGAGTVPGSRYGRLAVRFAPVTTGNAS